MQENQLHFYLLPRQKIFFENLSNCKQITVNQIFTDKSSQAIVNALKYRYSLKYLGKQCQDLFVLCIPAHQHKIEPAKQIQYQSHIHKFIKTKEQTQFKGYASGRRSAIFLSNNKLIRYKGCGNDTQGFIFQNKGLRGSHFYHTAKRQFFMTNFINSFLIQQTKQPSANIPLIFYQFPRNLQQYNLRNDLKLLPKYCCVFETQGDRRVGTHLISPLQILFLNIIKVQSEVFDQFFKKKERLDQYGLVQLLTDFELILQQGEQFINKYDKSKEFTNYVSIDDYQIAREHKIKQIDNIQIVANQIQTTFTQSSQKIQLNSKINWVEIINIILQKLGWQMGSIKRIFCEKQINWGFFDDHGYFHCNAHLNNFVTKIPNVNQRFILPLDFDLAFTKDQFINIDTSSPLYGERDDATFEQLLLSQYNAMQMSVSGLQIMNFKYSIKEEHSAPSQEVKQARIIFRDTLIKSFRQGMKKRQSQYKRINNLWNENIVNIKRLVEFCLIVSDNFQT